MPSNLVKGGYHVGTKVEQVGEELELAFQHPVVEHHLAQHQLALPIVLLDGHLYDGVLQHAAMNAFFNVKLLFHLVNGVVLDAGDEAGPLLTEQLEGLVVVVSLVEDVNGVVVGAEFLQQRVVVRGGGREPYHLGNGLIHIDDGVHLDPPFAFTVRGCSADALQDVLKQADDRAVEDLDLLVQHGLEPGVRDHVLILAEQIVIHAREEINTPALVGVRQCAPVGYVAELEMPGLA